MTLGEHLEVIRSGAVVLEIKDETEVIYKGFKGCLEYYQEAVKALDRKVSAFTLRTEARKRNDPQDAERTILTELNCGQFNFADLFIELVYSYELEQNK